jgi:hypothetical protein
MRKEEFKKWLEEKENKMSNAAYKLAINKIFEHYSKENNNKIDLYN